MSARRWIRLSTGRPRSTRRCRPSASLSGRDSGMSLTELMVVVALMGFVLSAAYALQFVVNKAVTANTPMAQGAAGTGDPMEFMSRIIMQSRSVVTSGTVRAPNGQSVAVTQVAEFPGDYDLAVATDRIPFNGSWELNYFHIDSGSPTLLQWDSWSYNTVNNVVGDRQLHWTMSATVNNRTETVPLFTYYGTDGTTPLTVANQIAGNVGSVRISLVMPSAGASSTQDTRLVSFRN